MSFETLSCIPLQTFIHRQVQLDDTTDADALALFPQCIDFIGKELEKGHGVLVHCHAGLSEWRNPHLHVCILISSLNPKAGAQR